MHIITTYGTTPQGAGKVTAKGMGKQKTTRWDASKSTEWNHGTAAGALIIAVSESMHPLTQQNADNLRVSAVRSIDSGHSTHTQNDSGTRHVFDV